jgi:hypothetical protein
MNTIASMVILLSLMMDGVTAYPKKTSCSTEFTVGGSKIMVGGVIIRSN